MGSPECCERLVDVPGPSRVSDCPERPPTAVALNRRRVGGLALFTMDSEEIRVMIFMDSSE